MDRLQTAGDQILHGTHTHADFLRFGESTLYLDFLYRYKVTDPGTTAQCKSCVVLDGGLFSP